MKIIKVLLFLIFTLVCFAGCGTMAAVPYSSTENNKAAEITFQTNLDNKGSATGFGFRGSNSKKSIQLLSVEGDEIPLPEKRKVWNPVSLPAETPLTLTVNVFYYFNPKSRNSSSTGTLFDVVILVADVADAVSNINKEGWRNMDVILNCPPLETGRSYKLEYIQKMFKKPCLVLTDISTKKIVYEQEVQEKWQAGGKGNWAGEKRNTQRK